MKGELCDDQNADNSDGCHDDCSLPRCRDGFVDPGEICDDGNAMEGDGCNALCSSTETCGNGVIDPQVGERCDAGSANSSAPDASCRPDCQYGRCGDGIVDAARGENCDGSVAAMTCESLGYYAGTLTCTTWPVSELLYDIWGTGPGNVWAVGANGTILHYDGSTWSIAPGSGTVTRNLLFAVSGSGPLDVWAVGSNVKLRYDGTRWSSEASFNANDVSVTAPDDAWAVGRTSTGYSRIERLYTAFPALNGGACTAPVELYCGKTTAPAFVQYGAVTATSPTAFSAYTGAGCTATRADDGREVYYKLHVPVTGQVKVDMTQFGADLDLLAVGADTGGGCVSTQCLAASQANGANVAESITMNVTQGQTLYFIVDGHAASDVGSFTLQTTCTK